MRTIRFRGKSKKTGEWLYGDLVRNVEGVFAIVPPFEISMNNYYGNYEVDKETIGQFTGLCDESGKAVYEGGFAQRVRQQRNRGSMVRCLVLRSHIQYHCVFKDS